VVGRATPRVWDKNDKKKDWCNPEKGNGDRATIKIAVEVICLLTCTRENWGFQGKKGGEKGKRKARLGCGGKMEPG